MRQFFYVEKHSLLITNIDMLVDAFKCLITDERFVTDDPELIAFWNGYKTDAILDRQYAKKLFKTRGKEQYKQTLDENTTDALLEVYPLIYI